MRYLRLSHADDAGIMCAITAKVENAIRTRQRRCNVKTAQVPFSIRWTHKPPFGPHQELYSIGPIHFLAGYCKTKDPLNQTLVSFALVLCICYYVVFLRGCLGFNIMLFLVVVNFSFVNISLETC